MLELGILLQGATREGAVPSVLSEEPVLVCQANSP